MTVLAKASWNFILAISIVSLLVHAELAFTSNDYAVARFSFVFFVLLLVFGYILFILEGLTVRALQLRSADRDRLQSYLSGSDSSANDILAITDFPLTIEPQPV